MCGQSTWFQGTNMGDYYGPYTHCNECSPSGDCDSCFSIDDRAIEIVSEYTSTCDGCGELAMHELMAMDAEIQLGYCPECVPTLPQEIKGRFGIELLIDSFGW